MQLGSPLGFRRGLGVACAGAITALAGYLSPLSAPDARADERLFTYSYEADALPVGRWEFEQWITHRRGKSGGLFSRWDLREEIEYGLTDRLTVAGYLNFQQTDTTTASSFKFKGISAEFKYQVLNPNTQPIGLSLYVEPTYSGDEAEVEAKLILQKNFGEKWVAVFNATLEPEWKYASAGPTTHETKLEFTTGVAYKINPHWSVGLEGRQRTVFDQLGFHKQIGSAWFVGPNVHYGTKSWWATFTVLPQVSGHPKTNGLDLGEHEKLEARLIVGLNF